MGALRIFAISALLLCIAAAAVHADNAGRIYGKLTTVDGEEFEGLIRWDLNEASWVDILNGSKDLSNWERRDRRKYRERSKTIKILGIKIRTSGRNVFSSGSAMSGLRFGHIKSLEAIDDDAALLTLKSGEKIEMESNSTDLGESVREIVIEDLQKGEIEFEWEDIERIDFMQADAGLKSNYGHRLYGTLKTRTGQDFSGWVCWDIDEMFTKDILDGKEKHRKRKIEFGKIASIARHSSSAAKVVLTSGEELVLRDTNDVDDDNRGIVISDPSFGCIVVEWDEFDKLTFTEPPAPVLYDAFDGGHRLEGTVYDHDGEEYHGTIMWDADEEYTWEILDGDYRDIGFDIEFGSIKSIERKGFSASIVTLWDGRSFKLGDSNDVDEDNKGIFIKTKDGDEIELEWDEFEKIEFVKR